MRPINELLEVLDEEIAFWEECKDGDIYRVVSATVDLLPELRELITALREAEHAAAKAAISAVEPLEAMIISGTAFAPNESIQRAIREGAVAVRNMVQARSQLPHVIRGALNEQQ